LIVKFMVTRFLGRQVSEFEVRANITLATDLYQRMKFTGR